MAIRGMRVLIAPACGGIGRRLVEACVALGAHVIAADALRTRIEELRAELRQHERLWVAECDVTRKGGAAALLTDAGRDEPLDAAVLVLEADACGLPPAALADIAVAFAEDAVRCAARYGRGRVAILVCCPSDTVSAALRPALAACATRAATQGIAVVALPVSSGTRIESLLTAIDPERPAPASQD